MPLFSQGKTRRFDAPMGEMSDLLGSKSPDFSVFWVDRQTHTHTQRTSHPGGTPLHAGKSQPVGGRSRPPTPTNSLLCQARKKWSTSSLFQPPHWSGRHFWGRPRGTLGLISRPWGPFLWPPARGVPPFWAGFRPKRHAEFRAQGAAIRPRRRTRSATDYVFPA